MRNNILVVSGGKGGVGKSLVSLALIDLLRARGERLIVIDADPSNPDIARALEATAKRGEIELCAIRLDECDGWLDLMNVLSDHSDASCVINTPARSQEMLRENVELLFEAANKLDRKVRTLWVIDRDKDVLRLLADYLKISPPHPVHVVRNLLFGRPDQFAVYENSKVRGLVEATAPQIDFPVLAARVASFLRSESKMIEEALVIDALRFGDRIELERWRRLVQQALEDVV